MSGLMIYVPRATEVSRETLTALGLAELFEPGIAPLPMPPGGPTPDGQAGRLVIFDDPRRPHLATPHHIDLESQTWLPAPPSTDVMAGELPAQRYWVGYETASPPGPEDLAREALCDGEPLRLADGRPWVVPVAPYLPQRLTRNPLTGEEERQPAAAHREFARRANELFAWFMSDEFMEAVRDASRVSIPQGLAFASLALAKNYRVNIDVVDALGLVSEWEAFEIARAACGLPPLEQFDAAAQKKTTRPPVAARSTR